jgi:hypothetical protein
MSRTHRGGEVVELFDGETLRGWHAVPRLAVPVGPGAPEPDTQSPQYLAAATSAGSWSVEDGAIVGRQDAPGSGLGGYLLTDERYSDVRLTFEVRPDWPADTGILVRASDLGSQGFQLLIDHRRSGGIGGFYGNGIGGFHALAFGVDVARDASGEPVGLVEDDPATTLEPVTEVKRALLSSAATAAEFFAAWRGRPHRARGARQRRGHGRRPVGPRRRRAVAQHPARAAVTRHGRARGTAVTTRSTTVTRTGARS